MPVEVRVPVLGESIVEATVGAWLKQAGEAVEAGEPLVQLETEKVNVDVAADQSGVLGALAAQEGDTVHPGDVLATIEDNAAAPRESSVPPDTSERPDSPEPSQPSRAADQREPTLPPH
ncbi:MAG: biotin/lipoyl-binding protein, partial [Chloroflexi bacterium]|nr:biotin/lipoyl-binding protein [Chloroflexota bacterium]